MMKNLWAKLMSNESFYNGCMISLKNMNWSMMMSQEQKYDT